MKVNFTPLNTEQKYILDNISSSEFQGFSYTNPYFDEVDPQENKEKENKDQVVQVKSPSPSMSLEMNHGLHCYSYNPDT